MSIDVYRPRPPVYVTAIPGAAWRYGYRSPVSESEKTDLGIEDAITATGGYVDGVLFGVDRPKPAQLRKVSATEGYDGSYCSADRINAALGLGYRMVHPILRRFGNPGGTRSRTVYVDTRPIDPGTGEPSGTGYRKAWTLPQYLITRINADQAALGHEFSNGKEDDLVWGADELFGPRRARKLFISAEGRPSYSETFVAPSREDNLPTGWSLV